MFVNIFMNQKRKIKCFNSEQNDVYTFSYNYFTGMFHALTESLNNVIVIVA